MVKKWITYKGKILFEKVESSVFARMPKYYEEDEACFMFLDGADFTIRSSTEILKMNDKSALLSKCTNYFFEVEPEKISPKSTLVAVGVMLYPSMISEIFDIDLLVRQKKKTSFAKTINIDPLLQAFKDSLIYLIDNPELADEAMILLKLQEFVQLMMRQQQNDSISDFFSNLFDPMVYNIEQTIQNNMYSNLSIAELAFLSHMSVSTFKRRFKTVYGESPHHYLLKKKIERACHYLKNTDTRITDIAMDCGFDGISTFNRNFKKLMGVSPSQWKEVNSHKE